MVIFSGENNITSVTLDEAGKYIAWADKDGQVTVWDIAEAKTIREFREFKGWAVAVAFAPDSSVLGSAGDDGSVVFRSTKDWTPKGEMLKS
jgi:WD40 repeat protein